MWSYNQGLPALRLKQMYSINNSIAHTVSIISNWLCCVFQNPLASTPGLSDPS